MGDRSQQDIGAVDDWLEENSEVSVPELDADLDDGFIGLDIAEQGNEATAVEEAQGEDQTDHEQDMEFTEEARESEDEGEDFEDNEEEWVLPQTQGAPSLSIKSDRKSVV